MSDELPQGWSMAQPVRAKENSPRIHPWVARRFGNESRQGRKKMFVLSRFFRPSGAWDVFETGYPAMNRWAIFGCSCGTSADGHDRRAGFSPLQRSVVEARVENGSACAMRTVKRRERRAPARNGGAQP